MVSHVAIYEGGGRTLRSVMGHANGDAAHDGEPFEPHDGTPRENIEHYIINTLILLVAQPQINTRCFVCLVNH